MQLDKHITITSSADIDDICRPLKKHLHINNLLFQRSFLNEHCQQDDMLFLGNWPEVLTHLVSQFKSQRRTGSVLLLF